MELDERALEKATRCLGRLSSEVTKMKQKDASRLNEEYQRLVRGLVDSGVAVAPLPAADQTLAAPGTCVFACMRASAMVSRHALDPPPPRPRPR